MYRETEGSEKRVIKHGYIVHLPKMPPKNQIAGYEKPKKEQMFQRTPLPDQWKERREEEKKKRKDWQDMVDTGKIDPKKSSPFVDPFLEKFRRQEWKKRMNGYWFYSNGKPIYITGQHYYYLNWTRWDHVENDGYPIFYENQLERFYFRSLCEQDPRSLGYIVIGPRGFGKSTEELACILERSTRPPRKKKAALQSKTEDDAKDILFLEKLVPTFNELPDFFKPEYDHGSSPVKELSFKRQRVTGKGAKDVEFGEELELLNRIYWAPAKDKALDGGTFQDILNDEIGKTEKHIANVSKRIKVNRNSVFRNNKKVGIIRACTTVEEMDKGGEECIQVWEDSNPDKRTENGQTISGLYKWFVSILEIDRTFADEYGVIDPDRKVSIEGVPEAKTIRDFHYAERKAREHDQETWADWCRKHPIDESDIRIKKGGDTTFNAMKINSYRNLIRSSKQQFVRGNFHWVDQEFGKVFFERDDIGGRWQLSLVLDQGEDNKFEYGYNSKDKRIMIPMNNIKFCAGVDPIKDVKTKNPRASKMSAHFFYKYDDSVDRNKEIEDYESHRVVAKYNYRPEDPNDAYRDVAMGMIYFGCWANIEGNVSNFNTWLKDHGMEKFKMTALDFEDSSYETKKSIEESLQSTPEVQQAYINKIRTLIARHFGKRLNVLPFDDTLEQLHDFTIEQVTFFDDVVSLGYCLLGDDAIVMEEEFIERESTEWFPAYDNSGTMPSEIQEEEESLWDQAPI